jgi:hypothetical protein
MRIDALPVRIRAGEFRKKLGDLGNVSQGKIWGKSVEVSRLNFPHGLSRLVLSVKQGREIKNAEPSFPILAELDELEVTDIKLTFFRHGSDSFRARPAWLGLPVGKRIS